MDAEARAARVIDDARQAREPVTADDIAEAIRAAVKEEREACARIVEGADPRHYEDWMHGAPEEDSYAYTDLPEAMEDLARKIRARGEESVFTSPVMAVPSQPQQVWATCECAVCGRVFESAAHADYWTAQADAMRQFIEHRGTCPKRWGAT